MKTNLPSFLLRALAFVAAALLAHNTASAQTLTVANPNWNITLTSYGYADLLFDNTPGFEGREYLSGEWGAAVSYQAGATPVAPQWLEPNFIFPDWVTNSGFHVVSPIAVTGVNADNLPIAQSVISNGQIEVTLRYEMLDTIVGTAMGTSAASAGGAGTFLNSNRYVLKQTYSIKNVSGAAMTNVQLFQFLHGLNAERGVYDNRTYSGLLSAFHYDTTLAGVDAFAFGTSAGLEDFIGFHASVAPTALEIGQYGIEGNGVDNHGVGKPSDGVHLSIEDNWQNAPFSTRQGTDAFAPSHRWVAGAQRWALGNLSAGQSTSFDVILSLLTGTKVPGGNHSGGSADGGSSVPGGVDYDFEDVSTEGSLFADFSRADADELTVHIAQGEFGPITFTTPGMPVQLWEVEFSGSYSGAINLIFGYDATLLPGGFDQSTLAIFHWTSGAWVQLPAVVDPVLHTIAFSTTSLGTFALGTAGGVEYAISVSVAPANSGTVTGGGTYASGADVTLTAAPNAGYYFANWSEDGNVISLSPSFTFSAGADRALVANFLPAGAARTIATSSTPANGGTTSGDGAYPSGSQATVIATANPGYKFSKWLENGVTVSSARIYTFSVTADRALVAKFKPVYTINVTIDPPDTGSIGGDGTYDPGDNAVLHARADNGYSFVNWTENGVVVSDDERFEFTVNANRDLVAHFAPGYRIDVAADPKSAGFVEGGGVYDFGLPVTVIATPKDGYVFLRWTDNGNSVSTSESYTFTPDRSVALIASFAALPAVSLAWPSSGNIIVTWPAGATDWTLQESTDLVDWANSTRTITVINGQNQVTVPTSEAMRFFRLVHP